MRLPILLELQNGLRRISGVLSHLIVPWAAGFLNGAKRRQNKDVRNWEPAQHCSYALSQAELQELPHSARIDVASTRSIRMQLTRSLTAKTTGSSGIRPR